MSGSNYKKSVLPRLAYALNNSPMLKQYYPWLQTEEGVMSRKAGVFVEEKSGKWNFGELPQGGNSPMTITLLQDFVETWYHKNFLSPDKSKTRRAPKHGAGA